MTDNKKFEMRVGKQDLQEIKDLFADSDISWLPEGTKIVDQQQVSEDIKKENVMLICGDWPPSHPSALMRLCVQCGKQVSVSPKNSHAKNFCCFECARANGVPI